MAQTPADTDTIIYAWALMKIMHIFSCAVVLRVSQDSCEDS